MRILSADGNDVALMSGNLDGQSLVTATYKKKKYTATVTVAGGAPSTPGETTPETQPQQPETQPSVPQQPETQAPETQPSTSSQTESEKKF